MRSVSRLSSAAARTARVVRLEQESGDGIDCNPATVGCNYVEKVAGIDDDIDADRLQAISSA